MSFGIAMSFCDPAFARTETSPGDASDESDGERAYAKSTASIYALRVSDVPENSSLLQPGNFVVRFAPSDVIPDVVRNGLGGTWRAARTKGDSACGVHALFGAPHGSVAPELVVERPRVLAASMLGPSLEALVGAGAPETHLRAISVSLWTEFVVPYMDGAPDPEPRYFWEALETNAPSLAREAQEIYVN